jgi:hypothetical protein
VASTSGHIKWAKTNSLHNVCLYDNVVRVERHTRTTQKKDQTSSELERLFLEEVQGLWPIAHGSLSLRKSPCVRLNCPTCAAGVGHRSYVLYGRCSTGRFSVYVPEELVPEVQKALENGRRLNDLVSEVGMRYALAMKNERKSHLRKKPSGGTDARRK